jgi:aquaporin Z
VRFAATAPGPGGAAMAFLAELVISFLLMSVVLVASNRPEVARYTPVLCGTLVAIYITVEAPISGMSMNPARSFASALAASQWTALWIYFAAPPVGMLAAAEVYVRVSGARRVLCAKLNHHTARRCIFRCDFGALGSVRASPGPTDRNPIAGRASKRTKALTPLAGMKETS